jgi:tetratricopeptide (TPR) repeat protein
MLCSRLALAGACLAFLATWQSPPAAAPAGAQRRPSPLASPCSPTASAAEDSTASSLLIFRVEGLRPLSSSERKNAFAEYVQAVRSALDSGRHAQALSMAERAAALWKNWRRPLLHLAAALLDAEKWGPAIESAREARRARDDGLGPPPRPGETAAACDYWEGVALYRTQRYDEALPLLERAAEKSPEWAEAFRALGEASFVAGRIDAAGAAYARALELEPGIGSPRDLAYFAETKSKQGDSESGIAVMQAALRRYPYAPGLHANLASMLRTEGDLVEAYYHFTLELLLQGTGGPFSAPALKAAGGILDEVGKQEKHPARHELLLVSTGLEQLREGRAHEAVHTFEHAVRSTSSPTLLPQLLYADALLRSGNAAAARTQLERLLDIEPDSVPALVLLADALRALGEHEQSRLTRRRAQELFPSYPQLRAAAKSG